MSSFSNFATKKTSKIPLTTLIGGSPTNEARGGLGLRFAPVGAIPRSPGPRALRFAPVGAIPRSPGPRAPSSSGAGCFRMFQPFFQAIKNKRNRSHLFLLFFSSERGTRTLNPPGMNRML